jgi:hypothetical protein
MKECTTHHFACDCREAKFKEMERENAALRELTSTLGAPNHINVPVEQWYELRADKERLDWLLTGDGGFWVNWMYDKDEWTPELKASRDAIDACRNWRIGNGRQP